MKKKEMITKFKTYAIIIPLVVVIMTIGGCLSHDNARNYIDKEFENNQTPYNYSNEPEDELYGKDQEYIERYKLIHTNYPDTDNPPVLEFKWDESEYGALKLTASEEGHIFAASPPGYLEENGFQNQETAIFFAHRKREPIYAPCDGVITYFQEYTKFEDAVEPNKGGDVWIRHGKNYAIGFRHVVTTDIILEKVLKKGVKVKKGDVLGYTADLGNDGSFFEFVLVKKEDTKNGTRYKYLKAYDYFDEKSRQTLLEIWNAAQIKDDFGHSLVSQPWGDVEEFETQGGQQESPFKGGWE